MPDSNPTQTLNRILLRLDNWENMSAHLFSTCPPTNSSMEILKDTFHLILHRLDTLEHFPKDSIPNNNSQRQSGHHNAELDSTLR